MTYVKSWVEAGGSWRGFGPGYWEGLRGRGNFTEGWGTWTASSSFSVPAWELFLTSWYLKSVVDPSSVKLDLFSSLQKESDEFAQESYTSEE